MESIETTTLPDLQKLRRFALAMGVILFSYVVADLSIKPNPSINLPLLVFDIGNPKLIPIGIVIASIYGMVRYWFYGITLRETPMRKRAYIRSRIASGMSQGFSNAFHQQLAEIRVGRLTGSSKLSERDQKFYDLVDGEEDKVKALKKEGYARISIFKHELSRFQDALEIYPKIPGSEVKFQVISVSNDDMSFSHFLLKIPRRNAIASWLQEIDYTLPVSLNLFALAMWSWSLL